MILILYSEIDIVIIYENMIVNYIHQSTEDKPDSLLTLIISSPTKYSSPAAYSSSDIEPSAHHPTLFFIQSGTTVVSGSESNVHELFLFPLDTLFH